MDPNSFDIVTRALARIDSRRVTLRLIAGGLAAGILARRGATPIEARGLDSCEASGGQGVTLCNGSCVILSIDRFNCGACGVYCEVEERCQDGLCIPIPDFIPAGPPPPVIVEDIPDEVG